jgi:ABC-type lipoprotein export system ATPase subunit
MMIEIYRVPRRTSPGRDLKFPCLVLEEDNWNDFGYLTLFHVRWFESSGKSIVLGDTKILQKGEVDTAVPKHFNELATKYCSLGQTIEYYEQIHDLGRVLQDQILKALRDIVAFPQIASAFEREEGFKTSLLRYSEAEQAFREGGKILRDSPLGKKEQISFSYSAKLESASVPHDVDLCFGDDELLPCRIVGFIGKNATGKTWLLSQLASDISGDQTRKGQFHPRRPAFGRVIAISYNALDRFRRPPRGQKTFSYQYCGIYDQQGRVIPRTGLLARISNSYKKLVKKDRKRSWERVLADVFDKHFATTCIECLETDTPGEPLNQLSSGQMILLTVLTELLASIAKNSLILYDEPELHLHPNAISSLIRSLARILSTFDSFAIIATHSPLIIQQIPAAYVRVFTRIENQTLIRELTEESFGENLSVLSETVFQVNATESLFRWWLKSLPQNISEARISKAFSKGLSFDAKSVIRTVLASRRREN